MALNSKRAKPYAFPLRYASQTRSEYLPVPILYPSWLLSTYLFSFSATKDKERAINGTCFEKLKGHDGELHLKNLQIYAFFKLHLKKRRIN